MKIRTSLRAGRDGCSPEAQYYMQKALAMQAKIDQCQRNYYPPENSGYPAYPPVGYVGGKFYPDRSGWCG